MHAYIPHYTPLKERKTHILQEVAREGITPVLIEPFDRDVLTASDLQKFVKTRKLKLGSISLILKHLAAWRMIVEKNEPYGLVLEDDAILASGFQATLAKYMAQLPSDFDVLMLNEGCNLHIPSSMLKKDTFIYFRGVQPTSWGGNGGTRCTDGYILSNKCAKQFLMIYDSLPNDAIGLPIDWLMNSFMRLANSQVYWAEPSIVKQGTETGLFKQSY
jgi:glycosyl transferase family 25